MKIKESVIAHHRKLGFSPDDKGYVASAKENLVSDFPNWSEIEDELRKGNGKELESKFCAVHSSSALCVNNFAPLKLNKDKSTFLSFNKFDEAVFEKKLQTGISTPNLDFYLRNKTHIIGVESKFTELDTLKFPNAEENLSAKYLNRKELNYLPQDFMNILDFYIENNKKMRLDVSQLIKHSIGLIKNYIDTSGSGYSENKKSNVVLLYLYWMPENWQDYEEYKTHRTEIDVFQRLIGEFITFVSMSYIEFWQSFENDVLFKEHIEKMRERYCFDI